MREGESRLVGRMVAACLFASGIGLGWGGASLWATRVMRDRDAADVDVARSRLEAEEMRLLDLDLGQRQRFLEAKHEVYGEIRRVLAHSRPEIEGILRQGDAKIRPMLSPRQLAVYDRLEARYRLTLPERPTGADD